MSLLTIIFLELWYLIGIIIIFSILIYGDDNFSTSDILYGSSLGVFNFIMLIYIVLKGGKKNGN